MILGTHLSNVVEDGEDVLCCWDTGTEWWRIDVVNGVAYTHCHLAWDGTEWVEPTRENEP